MLIFEYLKNISLLLNNKFDLVFYSESKNYNNLFLSTVKNLSQNKNIKILYISSDRNDKQLINNIKNIFVGKGLILSIFFNLINAKILVTTTTDLGNNLLKKNNKIENYVYLFHSPVSAHKLYTKTAFNNYDLIFCNGNYQFEELKKLEIVNKSKSKILKKTGYLYFDYLNSFKNEKKNRQILIAPSWNIQSKNFTSVNSLRLINELLTCTNYEIIFRPHPEQLKRDSKSIEHIKNNFSENKRFFLDLSHDNTKSLKNSALIITDYSGIALEFILVFKRPVIFINDTPKIHNIEFKRININTIEDEIRNKFGHQINSSEINNIKDHIEVAIKNFVIKEELIDTYLTNKFYNFGNTTTFVSKELLKILNR